jgi:hypothetical protein
MSVPAHAWIVRQASSAFVLVQRAVRKKGERSRARLALSPAADAAPPCRQLVPLQSPRHRHQAPAAALVRNCCRPWRARALAGLRRGPAQETSANRTARPRHRFRPTDPRPQYPHTRPVHTHTHPQVLARQWKCRDTGDTDAHRPRSAACATCCPPPLSALASRPNQRRDQHFA